MTATLMSTIFFAVPILALIFFISCLTGYLHAKYVNKHRPGTYNERQMKNKMTLLVIASVIAGMLLAVVIGLIVLLFTAVAFM